ncbi:S-adenosyl methyltransferase [Streptomyces sp. WMMB 714]|uniref:SAM-dependent methyltransferase n=1 Tax=Streptomyces sp. WMMB 714 TaxID=1286822 RepID=UPI0005F866F9|nr:SAM-dependent methyltransferase [Streptomyces sp. WMMB 714]SCK53053.1 S-adenosyl methyltransferase [Streptomyces sp. WMMB 714]
MTGQNEAASEAASIDPTVPHSARIFDFWLGGKDHFEADRSAGEQVLADFPAMTELARASREFVGRVVRHLVVEEGLRQFLDVGTGLPTAGNTHEVAQRLAPEARIVYVDHDPLVLAHAGRLLTCSAEGAAAYLHADAHDPDRILAEASATLDLDEPVGVLLMGILAHVERYTEARAIVHRLMQDLPAGSCLAIRDGTDTDEAYSAAMRRYSESGALPYRLRSPEEIARFFSGLELAEPGVVPVPQWRPSPGEPSAGGADLPVLGGVARKLW